jgi:muramoyltetrapeptide carboxypeptidase
VADPILLKPKALKPGDTVAIISPSGPTRDSHDPSGANSQANAFDIGVSLLASWGFQCRIMPNARNHHMGYLAGTDDERLSDVHQAFSDPSIQGILCARGGYGALRFLNRIDMSLIRQNPKVFVGFSDITALLLAFYQSTGLVGFYGPMLTSNLIQPKPSNLAESQSIEIQSFRQMIEGKQVYPSVINNLDAGLYQCFQPGVAQGRLVGGNLSLLRSLCGTPYQPYTQGAILFIEDWHERYYTLDRQFQHLKLAGMLDGIAGLLLADFSGIDPDNDVALPAFLKWLSVDLIGNPNIPIGYGFSVGHGDQTMTLPIGTQAIFDASQGRLTLTESPVLGE